MALNAFKKYLLNPIVNYFGRKMVDSKLPDTPIIIGGCGRSGTTLLLSIIGAHSNIYSVPEETAAFIEWHQDKNSDKYIPRMDRFYRYTLREQIPKGAMRWCEKTPRNVRYFGEILAYFQEDVRIIHIVRDGRDVMLSRHPNNPDKYWVKPKRWINDVKAGLKYKEHPQVLTIKYEDLILSYEDIINQICDFIDEECSEELIQWFEHTNVQDSNAWFDSAQKLHSKSVGKWKKEENQERVEEVMVNEEVVKLLEELDYL